MLDTNKNTRNEMHEKSQKLAEEWLKDNKAKTVKEEESTSIYKPCAVHGVTL